MISLEEATNEASHLVGLSGNGWLGFDELIVAVVVQGGSTAGEGGEGTSLSLVGHFVVSVFGLAGGSLDDGLDLFSLSDVGEGFLDVHAVGLQDWVVLGIMRDLSRVGVFEVELEDESGSVLNADGAGVVGIFWNGRKRWSSEGWGGTE